MDQSVTIIIVPNTNVYSHYIVCVSFPSLCTISVIISYSFLSICIWNNSHKHILMPTHMLMMIIQFGLELA